MDSATPASLQEAPPSRGWHVAAIHMPDREREGSAAKRWEGFKANQ